MNTVENYLQLLSDTVQEKDLSAQNLFFQFDEYGSLIADAICFSYPRPRSIAIFGEWGTGKTTLMKLIDKKIVDKRDAGVLDHKVITTWFDSWRFAHDENPLIPLLYTIRDSISIQAGTSEKELADFFNVFLPALLASFEVGFPIKTIGLSINPKNALDASENLNKKLKYPLGRSVYYDILKYFYQQLEKANVHIVVFIDDLDRCQANKVVNIIESIKLIMDVENITFVVGADHIFLRGAVSLHYDNLIDGQSFIKKVFPVNFTIPYPDEDAIKLYIDASLEKIKCGQDEKQQVAEIFINGSGHNPREIKRLINSYAILRKLLKNFSPNKAAMFVAIQQEWPIIIRNIAMDLDNFIAFSKAVQNGYIEAEAEKYREFSEDKTFLYFVKKVHRFFTFHNPDELKQYINLASISAVESLMERQIGFSHEHLGNHLYKLHPTILPDVMNRILKIEYALPHSKFPLDSRRPTTAKENFSLEIDVESSIDLEIYVYFKSDPDNPAAAYPYHITNDSNTEG